MGLRARRSVRRALARGSRLAGLLVVLALVVLALVGARPARAAPGDELRAYVLTMGPGDHPFFKFGHNALALVEPGRAVVYNFGTFTFDAPNLIPKFLRGRLKYWLSRSSLADTLAHYSEDNRTIVLQELDLTAAQKAELKRRLEENARPENREYLYDYFWDNCSTRVRDAVDAVVGGRVRAAGAGPGEQTFRAHALRMTADFFWVYLGLHAGLGSHTDQPIDRWRESFLPEKLAGLLRDVRVPAPGGGERPLVKEERVAFQASRDPVAPRPPRWTLRFFLVGLALGGGLLGLGWRAARGRRAARVALAVLSGLCGLLLGLLGVVLLALWIFTNHRAAWANENVLQAAPWAVALAALAVPVARGGARATSVAFRIAASAAAASLLGLLLKPLPWLTQENAALVALLLPVWLGLAAGLLLLRQRASVATSSGFKARP